MRTFVFFMLAACSDKGGDSGTPTSSGTTPADDTGGTTNTDCVEENGACVLTGTYTTDLHLTADKPWLLRSAVIIGDDSANVTLTIDAGTKLYGESATGGFLVISRGAKIMAEGTASAPIVFSSDQLPGSRARGDWGGVAINGRAPINACTDGTTPCEAEGEGGTGKYGGDQAADNSGVMRYVRIEFGGTEISPDNEINGLGLQGVGTGTTLEYIQVHRNLDDGIEFWGGGVSVKHLVITAAGDDGIDWDLGWQGRIQHAVVQQASDAGNHGMETDNNEEDHLAQPTSAPIVSNLTLVGSAAIAEDNFGWVIRRGNSPQAHNVAITGFSLGCLAIRDQATFDAFAAGTSSISHSALACTHPYEEDPEESETGTEDAVFEGDTSNHLLDDLGLSDPSNTSAPDFQPKSSSALLGAGQAPSDSFFDTANYIGAFDGTNNWMSGWTDFPAN